MLQPMLPRETCQQQAFPGHATLQAPGFPRVLLLRGSLTWPSPHAGIRQGRCGCVMHAISDEIAARHVIAMLGPEADIPSLRQPTLRRHALLDERREGARPGCHSEPRYRDGTRRSRARSFLI